MEEYDDDYIDNDMIEKMLQKVEENNYDLCINSASYGIQGSVDLIRKMIRNDN